MNDSRYLPDTNRVGVLTAAVLLAFALTRLIQIPEFNIELQLPGFYFSYPLSLGTFMIVMAAGLTATGMDWLLRSHPSLETTQTIEHWVLPTLATFIIGIPLTILPPGNAWWLGFGISGLLLALVFLAEYIVVEPSAPNYAIASAGLTALSFAVYLILTTALRFSGARLFLLAPALFIAAGLVSLRTLDPISGLHPRILPGTWPACKPKMGIQLGDRNCPRLYANWRRIALLADLTRPIWTGIAWPVVCAFDPHRKPARRNPASSCVG